MLKVSGLTFRDYDLIG